MTQAVLYVNEFGKASINAAAIMENAIELVFNTTAPEDIDILTIPGRIESAHASLLGIAAKLLANGMMGNAPAQAAQTPAARKEMVREVAGEVAAAVVPAPAAAPVVALAPVTETLPTASPVEAKPTARILELPLERPLQPRKEPQAKARTSAKRATPLARAPVQEAFPLGEVVVPAEVKAKGKVKAKEAPKRRRSDIVAPKEKLPRRLSKKEDALKMDTIVCLEDGQKVVDLGKHLETLGITPEEYQRKWGLSDSYPMRAPTFIQKRGVEYEYDPVHKRMIKMS